MGDLKREERNEYAKNLAEKVLREAGVEITGQIEMIISGAIEIVCILLPHGVKPETEVESKSRE